jgi:cobalt/nickel transport system ATP-binding protein
VKVLAFEQVSFAWEHGRTVLDGCDFDAEGGETVGLIGPNGAGKTTLFLLAAGIVRPASGRITVLASVPGAAELRGKVGLVFQSTDEQLFCSTVEEDVAFGPVNLGLPAEAVRARVEEALALVGLGGWENRVPHHLSGGEKRKVALAAVLSMQPELVLLDEPTSDLGSRSRRELLEVLKRLPGTTVIASHDFEFLLEVADRVAVLSAGRIQRGGPPAEIFRREEELARWGLEVPRSLRALLAGS